MEPLFLIIVLALGFVVAFGLAFGALEVLFSAMAPMTPALACHPFQPPDRRLPGSSIEVDQ